MPQVTIAASYKQSVMPDLRQFTFARQSNAVTNARVVMSQSAMIALFRDNLGGMAIFSSTRAPNWLRVAGLPQPSTIARQNCKTDDGSIACSPHEKIRYHLSGLRCRLSARRTRERRTDHRRVPLSVVRSRAGGVRRHDRGRHPSHGPAGEDLSGHQPRRGRLTRRARMWSSQSGIARTPRLTES
jgi:hypothetical protein